MTRLNHPQLSLFALLLVLVVSPSLCLADTAPEASAVVEKAFNYMRGKTSVSTVAMTIHRPDFERTMVIKGWTEGKRNAVFFIESPPKDSGNGTLKKGREMWSYNPKINRVIKLPPSMMSQSWMGSDFSNDDLSKTDSILDDYTHRIKVQRTQDGMTVYDIESIPMEEAPVVWGKQEMTIREDGILLRQTYYDQDMEPVKEMVTEALEEMGGRLFPKKWIMRKSGQTERYTRLVYQQLAFDVKLRPGLFTLTQLKNPKR